MKSHTVSVIVLPTFELSVYAQKIIFANKTKKIISAVFKVPNDTFTAVLIGMN